MKGSIILFVGTRPEAIKMAPVVMELRKRVDPSRIVVCSTGQHREMLSQVLKLFEIEPRYDLGLMEHKQSLENLTSKAIMGSAKIIREVEPSCVLVQGDTTTSMACALSAFYQRVPVGHVEAGLRTRNMYFPFPEEINRQLITRLSSFHFARTQTAVDALIEESIEKESILLTGNTVIDALFWVAEKKARLPEGLVLNGQRLILVTAHRRESWGKPLENICDGILEVTEKYKDVEFVYPVHKNPSVNDTVREKLAGNDRIHLLPPVDYDVLVGLMKQSYFVLTDSGGIQEEAPALGKPVLVLRNETERPEAVEAGVVSLVGPNRRRIVDACTKLLVNHELYRSMSRKVSPYGDGKASARIADFILERMGK